MKDLATKIRLIQELQALFAPSGVLFEMNVDGATTLVVSKNRGGNEIYFAMTGDDPEDATSRLLRLMYRSGQGHARRCEQSDKLWKGDPSKAPGLLAKLREIEAVLTG